MANRITGFSGMDVESLVGNLMKVEQMKVDKLYKQRTTLTWKQEMYKSMADSMSSFQSKYLGLTNGSVMNLRSTAFFLQKNFSVKMGGEDSKAVTIKNKSLQKGDVNHKITVKELAQAQKMIGSGAGQDGYGKKIVSDEIDVNSLKAGMSVSLNLDGKVVTASLSEDFVNNLSGTDDEKLAAVAAELNDQFKAFGKGTGVDNKVKVTADDGRLSFATESGRSLSISSFNNGYTASSAHNYIPDLVGDSLAFKINGQEISVSTLDDEGNKVNAEELAKRLNDTLNATTNINPLNDATGEYAQNFVFSAVGEAIKFEARSTDTKYTVQELDTGNGVLMSSLKDPDSGEMKSVELYGKRASEFGIAAGASTDNTNALTVSQTFGSIDLNEVKINGKSLAELGITGDTSIANLMSAVNDPKNELDVKLSYSSVNGAFTMESTKQGAMYGIDLSDEAVDAFGFGGLYEKDVDGNYVRDADGALTASADAVSSGRFLKAQDARIIIDGVETTRESNEIVIGELSLTLNEADPTKEISISSSANTDDIIKDIKEFINSYNELLTSFTTAYSESKVKNGSYGYYEPLSDEEKYALSDKDIELWEASAKKGLMQRDSTVGRVVDQLRNAMSAPVALADGRKISLNQIGIGSTDWRDRGVLTVDEDKLRKALEENPEDVAALFSQYSSESYLNGDRGKRNNESGIAYRLDDIVQDATRNTPRKGVYGYFVELAGGKTANMFENDMSTRLKEINNKIFDLEALNLSKENTYYAMFSKMEQAMTKAQGQMSMAGLG